MTALARLRGQRSRNCVALQVSVGRMATNQTPPPRNLAAQLKSPTLVALFGLVHR